jgi:hydroxymethylpyrimidine/phosphomethylpyrimidine kinase
VITPNVPEARVLAATAGDEAPQTGAGDDDIEALARRLHELGPANVVITGGHRDDATDLFFDGEEIQRIPGERHPDGAAHGSGCTHSSALAAHLALGHSPLEAARQARRIAGEAVRDGLRGLGRGAGPVDVFALTRRHRPGTPTGRAATGPLA